MPQSLTFAGPDSGTRRTLDSSDDSELMKQIESGSVDAFEALHDRYRMRAYRAARSVCRDHGRAEDAVQEAFASIWRCRAPYRPDRGTVAAWLLGVVRYRAIDLERRNQAHGGRRAGEAMLGTLPASYEIADQTRAAADAARLHEMLDLLPDAQRDVIALAFYGQLTHTEIATRLGLPTGTVKGRMRLGLNRLRADVEHIIG